MPSRILAEPLPDGTMRTIMDVLPSILPPDLQGADVLTFFKRQITAGKCVILFDGLDEVPTEDEFKAVVKSIESFAVTHPKNQCIVTSRIAGWRTGLRADFQVSYISELTAHQIDSFIETWCNAVERNAIPGSLKDEGKADRANRMRRKDMHAAQLRQAIRSNVGMRQLATNPMLLSIIALVHRSLPDLPHERTKLYSECSKILLEQWDMLKGRHVDDTRLRLEQKETILRRVAFAFHTGEIGKVGGGREALRTEVEALIAPMLPTFSISAKDAGRLLSRLIERSGIIVERKRGVLAFSHLTFQEYFVAAYLAKSKDARLLFQENRIFSDWWREVAVMYAGLLEDSSDFLRELYRVKHVDLFSTKLILGGVCLGESQVVSQLSVRQAICSDLAKIKTLGALVGPTAELGEYSGYLTEWCRTRSARLHGIAFAISSASDSDQNQMDMLRGVLAEGETEEIRLVLEALHLIPKSAVGGVSDILCSFVKGEDRTSAEALELLSRVCDTASYERFIEAVESGLSSGNDEMRVASVTALGQSDLKWDRLKKFQGRVEALLSDPSWRVRQGAAEVYARFVFAMPGDALKVVVSRLEEEPDADVIRSLFGSIDKVVGAQGEEYVLSAMELLLSNKRALVRIRAASTVAIGISRGSADVKVWGRFLGRIVLDKSVGVQSALSEGLRQVREQSRVDKCLDNLLDHLEDGTMVHTENSLALIGTLYSRASDKSRIDKVVMQYLKSGNPRSIAAAARAIERVGTWRPDDESMRILLYLASGQKKFRLTALGALGAVAPFDEDHVLVNTVERALRSRKAKIQSVAARAALKMPKGAAHFKDVALNVLIEMCKNRSWVLGSSLVSVGEYGVYDFGVSDNLNDLADASVALRDLIVAGINSKGDASLTVERVIDEISSVEEGEGAFIVYLTLARLVGMIAEKFPSSKLLEKVFSVLQWLDARSQGVDLWTRSNFQPVVVRPAWSGFSVGARSEQVFLAKEVAGAVSGVHARDAVRLLKNAMENQGSVSKITVLHAIRELDADISVRLWQTVRELANNDLPGVRDAAWATAVAIHTRRGTWHLEDKSTETEGLESRAFPII